MVAAYRFFDNEKVDFENVLQPHIDATHQRIAEQPVALLVHDTTELDLTRPASTVEGVGPLHRVQSPRGIDYAAISWLFCCFSF
jgi:hypothetical protein